MNKNIVKLDSDRLSAMIVTMLEQQWKIAIPVTGNSMYPLWKHHRDSVVLASCNPHALKKGDIALYRRSTGQVVLHRIVKVHEDSYDMCGDSQSEIERHLLKSNVMAVTTSFIRKGKEYNCNQFGYRMYTALWLRIRPLRKAIRKGIRAWRIINA